MTRKIAGLLLLSSLVFFPSSAAIQAQECGKVIAIKSGQKLPTDSSPISNPYTKSTDIHITHCKIRPYKTGDWHHQVDVEMTAGQTFKFELEGRVRNKSNYDLKDVDIDYCFVKDKKFFALPADSRMRLDDDQVDIHKGEKESKHCGCSRVALSKDLMKITVSTDGAASFTLPITEENIEEREITLYFYLDVETRKGEDRDVSDEAKTDEYAKIEITMRPSPPIADFTANPTSGVAPLKVAFSNKSNFATSYIWTFGDGSATNTASPTYTYKKPGTYTATLKASSDLGSSTKSATVTVLATAPQQSFTITSPKSGTNWRSDKTRDIKWTSKNISKSAAIAIYYSYDGGKTWLAVSTNTNNDGTKHWEMCKSKTKDSKNCYIKIVLKSNTSVVAISQKFAIDHASGCK